MRALRLSPGVRELLAPPRCLGCRRLSRAGLDLGLCPGCRRELGAAPVPAARAGLDRCWAAAWYEGPALGVVAALKRGAVPAAAATAAELIAERLGPPPRGWTLVPVGPAPRRLLVRGLDPAAEIAAALAARLELPVAPVLRRVDGRPQRARRRELRLSRPPRFRVRGRSPERALLVDDVLTTGATLGACARALRHGGAVRVEAVAFARARAARSVR